MSETLTAPEQARRPLEITVQGNQVHNAMWGIDEEEVKIETATTQETVVEKKEEVVETKTEPIVETKVEDSNIVDADKYVKENFGWDSIELGKKEISELRERVKELDLPNDESKKILSYIRNGETKKLYQFLHEQEQVERLTTADLSDKNIAAELVKFGIANKNKNLTKDEVEFLFNERFSIPAKPIQGDDLDEDYNSKLEAWKNQVANIEKRLVIEGKLAQPELEQLKSKLVLPDIQPQQQEKQLSQEELDAAKKFDEVYLNSVNDSLKNFNGFSVKVKNEAVGLPEISIPYVAIDSEKNSLSQELADFAKNGYNSNSMFAPEWVNQDGTINTRRVAEDRYLLKNRDRILQKVAEEAATKGVEAYIKGKKNIDITQTNQTGTSVINKDDKTELDSVRDQFFS